MKRCLLETAVFALLVAAGAASRVWFREVPNFAPIAAMALFAGYYFRSAWTAPLVPLLALSISDAFIGGYDWKLMAVVYGSLTAPVALRPLTRSLLQMERGNAGRTAASLAGLWSCSLCCSLGFFLATNFACWYGSTWYPQTAAGLAACFSAAVPFFRYTLLGDLFYACVLFGGYAVAVNYGAAPNGERELAAAGR